MPAITRFPGHQKFDDNIRLYFGSGASPSEAGDASIYFDGTNLLISGALVYSGAMNFDSTIDQDLALTAAGDGFNQTVTINHATATVEGQDLAVTQLTTARSSGEVVGYKVSLTGVATDSGGTYIGMDLNASDAGGSGAFIGIKMDAGWDAFADLSECATGEADIILGDNLAAAFVLREGSNNYLAIDTTNSTETVAFGNATTNPVYSFLGSGGATFTGGLSTDTIAERTSAAGVTIDGVTLKDDCILSLVLADYADDAAAAGGGIAVGQLYRTLSAVKVRVA